MLGKITKSTVERLPTNTVLWDSALVGFGVRKQRRHPHYLLRYRINGRQKFISIGRHGMWTADTARTEAQRLLGLIATKIDPAAERQPTADTFIAEVNRYLDRKRGSMKPRSMVETRRHLLAQSKPLHHLRLTELEHHPT